MIEQLKTLEATILDVRKRYHITATELKNLKAKPTVNASDFEQAKQQLANSNEARDTIHKQLQDLDTRYQTLAEAHHTLSEEQHELVTQLKELQQQNAKLKAQNQALQEKNRVATEHVQVVLERLTHIDQMSDLQ